MGAISSEHLPVLGGGPTLHTPSEFRLSPLRMEAQAPLGDEETEAQTAKEHPCSH